MTRKAPLLLLVVTLMAVLSGCWSRKELNELSIAVALGLDRSENDKYVVSLQIINPGAIAPRKSGPQGSPVYTFRTEASSLMEAMRKMTTQINRQIYMSHLRLVVIGENLARQGIADPLDFLSRNHEMRSDFYLIVAKQASAEQVLSILTPEDPIPANELYSSLSMSDKLWAATGKVTLDQLVNDLAIVGRNPVLTGLVVRGPESIGKTLENFRETKAPAMLQYSGMAVFRKDKLIGWLDENQSKGYNYIRNNVVSTTVTNECKNGHVEVEVIRTHTKLTGEIKNGEPEMRIDVHAEGNLGDLTCDLKIDEPAAVRQIERLAENNMREKITAAVRIMQTRYRADAFGFGEAIHRKSPKHWKKWRRNWDSTFAEMTVHTYVDVKIRRIGTIKQSVKTRVWG